MYGQDQQSPQGQQGQPQQPYGGPQQGPTPSAPEAGEGAPGHDGIPAADPAPAQPHGAPPPPAFGAVPPQAGPDHPAGGYPGYGYTGYPPAGPKKSRRTLWILLGCLGGVAVLSAGLLTYFVVNVTSKAGTHKIVLPAAFKGMDRDDTSDTAQQLRDSVTKDLGTGDGAWTPTGVGALYEDAEGRRLVVVGGYGKVLQPQKELDSYFKGILSSDTAKITGRHGVDAGPLGGRMDCAVVSNGAADVGICAWADSSGIIGVMEAGTDGGAPDLEATATDARDLRALAEVPK